MHAHASPPPPLTPLPLSTTPKLCVCVSEQQHVLYMLFTRTIRHDIERERDREREVANMLLGEGRWGVDGCAMHVHVCDFCRFVCVHIDIAKSAGAQH